MSEVWINKLNDWNSKGLWLMAVLLLGGKDLHCILVSVVQNHLCSSKLSKWSKLTGLSYLCAENKQTSYPHPVAIS